MTSVRFDNVSIIFGDKPQTALSLVDQGKTRDEIGAATGLVLGVADASLTIEEGEILVLMGLSGSGKSTLLRAVNGLAPVVRGKVSVSSATGPVDPYACSPKALRDLRMHTVSMVFQQFALLPWRTVAENVGFGLELAGMPDVERKKRVEEQLELVNLTKWADRKVNELSGGMQQRVGLARALANDAPVLLMDEAYSALDPLIRTDMQTVLLDIQKEIKKTIVFITHDLDEALRLGDQIAILRDGEVIQQGTSQDIVLRPADEYIANFVKEVNRGRVVHVEAVMTPLHSAAPGGLTIVSGTTVEEAVRMLAATPDDDARVVSPSGETLGLVTFRQLAGAMVNSQEVAARRDNTLSVAL
jgi:glycine betaine/proline transport system ATP-binding protein